MRARERKGEGRTAEPLLEPRRQREPRPAASRARHHHRRAALLEPEREQSLGFGFGQRLDLDHLGRAVEPVELGCDSARLDLVGSRQEPRAKGRIADPPAGVDARPDHEAQMLGPRRTVGARDVEEGGQPGPAALAHHL